MIFSYSVLLQDLLFHLFKLLMRAASSPLAIMEWTGSQFSAAAV
uniref:Uncharacterized protein n=1 Tax=Anguilla anguilla TaxID=7936 RepID=A0A0E9T9R1_ANGAN